MTCTTKFDPTWGAVLVKAENGMFLHMPTLKAFDNIRFHIATRSHTGGRLSEAYKAEGWEDIIPLAQYTSCIKSIYQKTDFDPVKRLWIDKPIGDWIYDEACKCLTATKEGRMDLGDGFVVPSPDEQVNINSLVFASSYSFYSAIQNVCPNITPPLESITCIENTLKAKNWQYYDIYRACRAEYLLAQSITPASPGGSPPPAKKSSKIIYVFGGILIMLLLLSKPKS